MKAVDVTVQDFIGGSRKAFIIPPYQRNYAWGIDQCRELYEDIMGTNYYFDRKNSKELSELISKQIGFLDAETVRERLFDRIHICKLSGGWIPLFQGTEYYKSLDELKEFYRRNKDTYIVINEYDEQIDFDELLEKCTLWRDKDNNKSHLTATAYGINFRICPSGCEWSDMKFF